MKRLIAVALFVCSQAALADDMVLKIPGEAWSIRLQAPAMQEINQPDEPPSHVYTGNAGRFNLSLYVEKPDCDGGDSRENLAQCFVKKVQRNPYIVKGTLANNPAAGGVLITYLMEVPVHGQKIRAFNSHYVFAHNGMWGDLHISVVKATDEDFATVGDVIRSIEFVEDAK